MGILIIAVLIVFNILHGSSKGHKKHGKDAELHLAIVLEDILVFTASFMAINLNK